MIKHDPGATVVSTTCPAKGDVNVTSSPASQVPAKPRQRKLCQWKRKTKWMVGVNRQIMQEAVREKAVGAQLPNHMRMTDTDIAKMYGVPPRTLRRYTVPGSPFYVPHTEVVQEARQRLREILGPHTNGLTRHRYNMYAVANGMHPISTEAWDRTSRTPERDFKCPGAASSNTGPQPVKDCLETEEKDTVVHTTVPPEQKGIVKEEKQRGSLPTKTSRREDTDCAEQAKRKKTEMDECSTKNDFLDVVLVFSVQRGAMWWI